MKFIIEVPDIIGVSAGRWKEYIRDAVRGWGGEFHPSDPLFGLTARDINITLHRERDCGEKSSHAGP